MDNNDRQVMIKQCIDAFKTAAGNQYNQYRLVDIRYDRHQSSRLHPGQMMNYWHGLFVGCGRQIVVTVGSVQNDKNERRTELISVNNGVLFANNKIPPQYVVD